VVRKYDAWNSARNRFRGLELGRYKPEDSMPRNTLVLVGSKFSNPTSNSNSGTGAKAPVEREPVLV